MNQPIMLFRTSRLLFLLGPVNARKYVKWRNYSCNIVQYVVISDFDLVGYRFAASGCGNKLILSIQVNVGM